MTSALIPLRDNYRTWFIYLCIIGVLSVVYFGSLKDHLLGLDDANTFKDNIAISEDFSYFFQSSEKTQLGSGRPVAELIKYLAFIVWGNDPGWYHLLVVAIHALASFFMAVASRKLGMNLELSLLGGLLFLLNTAHFGVVHWISALDYSLALVWGFIAVLCFISYLNSQKIASILGFYAILAIGLMSHLSAVAVWPFCLYWSWHKERRFKSILFHLLPIGLVLSSV